MIQVAVVEDIQEVRDGLKLILNNTEGFSCIAAYGSAEEAILNLPAVQPDIAIMDIQLPGISGIQCISRVRDACPQTQFMMFSVYDDDEHIFDALQAGASGYLLKKTAPGKIIEALTDLQNGGSPMSTHIARKVVQAFRLPKKPDGQETNLSAREMEVVTLLAKGLLYKEIGDKLHIATGTVRQHIHRIYEKLHVQNKTEAINKVFR